MNRITKYLADDGLAELQAALDADKSDSLAPLQKTWAVDINDAYWAGVEDSRNAIHRNYRDGYAQAVIDCVAVAFIAACGLAVWRLM